MKNNKLWLLPFFLMIFCVIISCSKEELNPLSSTSSDSRRANVTQKASTLDGMELKEILGVVQLGMIDLAKNDQIKETLKELMDQIEGSGYYAVTLKDLKVAIGSSECSLVQLMESSVLTHGGNKSDVAMVSEIVEGFEWRGNNFLPEIYLPFKDGEYFDQGDWDGISPNYFGSELDKAEKTIQVVDGQGNTFDLSEMEAATNPIWFAGVSGSGSDGDDIAERFWSRCACQHQGMSDGAPTLACKPGAETLWGRCGRTGLFNNNCSGTCGAATD
ncbi:MAG: hypothetical protein ACFB10_17210 [Salibacteraceae bacterium]